MLPFSTSGLPYYWMHEQSGQLQKAIIAYINSFASESGKQIFEANKAKYIALIGQYLKLHLQAPCWKENAEGDQNIIDYIDSLIIEAENVRAREDIAKLTDRCLDIGIDPF